MFFSCAQHARYEVKQRRKERGEETDKIKREHDEPDELSTPLIPILA